MAMDTDGNPQYVIFSDIMLPCLQVAVSSTLLGDTKPHTWFLQHVVHHPSPDITKWRSGN